MERKVCFLCGLTDILDDIYRYDGKVYHVHELCKLRQICFRQQDEIEKLKEKIRKFYFTV